jgi:hypothetical protein
MFCGGTASDPRRSASARPRGRSSFEPTWRNRRWAARHRLEAVEARPEAACKTDQPGRRTGSCRANRRKPARSLEAQQQPRSSDRLPQCILRPLGLPSLALRQPINPPSRRARIRMPGGLGGAPRGVPLSPIARRNWPMPHQFASHSHTNPWRHVCSPGDHTMAERWLAQVLVRTPPLSPRPPTAVLGLGRGR